MVLEQTKTTAISLSVTSEQSSVSRIDISKHSEPKNREENCDSKYYRAIHGITSNEVGKHKKRYKPLDISPRHDERQTSDENYFAATESKTLFDPTEYGNYAKFNS